MKLRRIAARATARNLALWLRELLARARMGRAVRRLNVHAAFFGFGPLTEDQWRAALARCAPAVARVGLSAADAAAGFERVGKMLHGRDK